MSRKHLTPLLLFALAAGGCGQAQVSAKPRPVPSPSPATSSLPSDSPSAGTVAATAAPTVVAQPPPSPVFAPVFGFDFSPFTVGDRPGDDVPDSRITSLLGVLKGRSAWVKIGSVTGGEANVPRIAKSMGFKVAATAYLSGDAAHDTPEVQQLEADINAGYVDLAMVGSEAVWIHAITAEALATEMDTVRSDIKARVPVATVEPDQAWFDHPILAQHADVVVANITPFSFHVPYDHALAWFKDRYAKLQQLSGRTVYVGETEWASAGGDFGGSIANQYYATHYFAAIEHWARPNHVGVFYFEAFDEPWLSSTDSKYGPHWGVFTSAGVLKSGMEDGFLTP